MPSLDDGTLFRAETQKRSARTPGLRLLLVPILIFTAIRIIADIRREISCVVPNSIEPFGPAA
jgi:hypothetical protein